MKGVYKAFFVFAIFFFGMLGNAAAWQHNYGGVSYTAAVSAVFTSDGGFIAAGSTNSYGYPRYNAYIFKTDSHGVKLWQKTFGNINYDYRANAVLQLSDGYAVAGYYGTGGMITGDGFLIKTDVSGNQVWRKDFGGMGQEIISSMQRTTDGGFILAGTSSSYGYNDQVYLIKTDADGNCVWAKTYGNAVCADYGRAVRQTSNGGYIIAGSTECFGEGELDFYAIRTDADGNCVWSKTFGGVNYDRGAAIVETSDAGFVIAGDTLSFGAGSYDFYAVRVDAAGNSVWSMTYGGSGTEQAFSIASVPGGGFVMAGGTTSFGRITGDVYIVKLAEDGTKMWERLFGGSSFDQGYGISTTPDNGFIIAGETGSFRYDIYNDAYLIKINEYGIDPEQPTATPTVTVTVTNTITPTRTPMGYSWGGTGLWHEIPDAAADTLTGDPRPFSSGSPNTWWYGQDATGNYDTGGWNFGELVTPFISIGNGQALYFWSWEQTEKYHSPDYYDQRIVYVSADAGETWTKIRQCYGTEDQWYEPYADLSAYASQSVIFKFVFDTDYSSYANNYLGWFLDDLRIDAAPTATVTRTNTPVCSPTSTSTYIPESDWQLANNPGFSPRAGHSSVVFDGKMWVIAGASSAGVFSDVWYTANGVDWVLATGNAAFGARNMHRCLVYDNRMWLVGGGSGTGGSKNDVWYSYDGADWILATSNAAFSPRSGFSLLEHDGKMWVIDDGMNLNDVWSSTDGVTWTQVTANAAFPARSSYASAVYDGKMWVIGGYIGSTPSSPGIDLNDVWYSTDGVNWTQAVGDAAFPPRSAHTVFVHDGRMWLTGGADVYTAGIRMNDVWFSYDGAVWYQATSHADFSPRMSHTSASFLGKMWVIGGRYSWALEYNEAWYSPVGLLPNTTASVTFTQSPVYTPTTTPTASMTPTYMIEQDWTLATAGASFSERSSLSAVSYACRLWVIGGVNSTGTTYYGDVWYTEDGSTWNIASSAADFGPRYGHTSFEYGGYMWVVGGRKSNGAYQRDAWRSDNGADWQAVTLNAGFTGRGGHTSVVFDGKMWVIAGIVGGSYAADVWYSSDGANWIRAAANAAFGARSGHSSVVFDGKMWVIGGTNGMDLSDAWYSTDGVSWYKASNNIGYAEPRRGHTTLSYNGKIWVIGGQAFTLLDDIWWSADGYSWNPATLNAGFQGRARHASAVFKDKMWVIAGTIGTVNENDVWYSPPGPVPICGTQTATCTVTETAAYTATATPTPSRTAIETDWVLATGTASFSARSYPGSVSFDGKLWVIGGIDSGGYVNDAWYSENGADWVLATGNAQFGRRYGQVNLVYNGMMWVIGGRNFIGGNVLDDVWSSADGANWTRVSMNADFGQKVNHAGVVFDGKMWVLGGLNSMTVTNDVWSSSNGTDWDSATGNAAFTSRLGHAAVEFNNKLWVIGGNDGNKLNDVWYSDDGVIWNQATASAAFTGRSGHSVLVYDGRMWVIGGSDQSGTKLNDVWWSADGITWQAANTDADFSGRANHASAVFAGKMWVISGEGGARDVWYSPPGPFGTPTVTVTVTPSVMHTLTPTVTSSITQTPSQEITPTETEEPYFTDTPTCTETAVFTHTPTPTATTAGKLFFAEEPLLYPNPLVNDYLKIRINLSKSAPEFRMNIYTVAFRRVKSIVRTNLPAGVSTVELGANETRGLASGVYYFIITVKDSDTTDSSKPSQFIVIRP